MAALLLVACLGFEGPRAHAAVMSDLITSVAGPATSQFLALENYTWTITNQGPDAGDGAAVQLSVTNGWLDSAHLTCRATGGATCPTFTGTNPVSAIVSGFPAGGSLTIAFSVSMPWSGVVSVDGSVMPAADTDPDLGTNSASMTTAVVLPPPRPAVAHYEETATPTLNTPYTVTETISNLGLDALVDVHVQATVSGNGVTSSWTQPTCAATGGAVCPSGMVSGETAAAGTVLDVVVAFLPRNGSLTFSYMLTNHDPSPVCGDFYGVGFRTTASGSGMATGESIGVTFPKKLTDAAVETTASPVHATGGQAVTLAATVLSMCGTIDSLAFRWTLPPSSGFQVSDPLAALSCTPTYGTCPGFEYDPVTRVLSTTFRNIGPGRFTLTLAGVAGLEPGSAWAVTAEVYQPLDITPQSDRYESHFDVTNSTWPISVGFILSPGSSLAPTDLTVTGTLHCAAAGDRRWSMLIRAGDDQAWTWVRDGWQGDSCTFVADALPEPPPGYVWSGGLSAAGTTLPMVSSSSQAVYSALLVPTDPEAPSYPTVPSDPTVPADPTVPVATSAPASALPASVALAATGSPVGGLWPWASGLLVAMGAVLVICGRRWPGPLRVVTRSGSEQQRARATRQ